MKLEKLFLIGVLWAASVFALNTHLIRPVGDQYGGFSVHGTQIPQAGTFELGGVVQYVSNPVDFQRFSVSNQSSVESMSVLDSYFTLGFFDWLSIGAVLPIAFDRDINNIASLTEDAGTPSLGDLYLHATLRLLKHDKGIGIALVPFATLPLDTNTLDQFNNSDVTVGGYLIIDQSFAQKHYVGFNFGGQYRFEEEAILGSAFRAGHSFLYAAAYSYTPSARKNIDLFIEARGSSNFEQLFTEEETSPLEALAGIRVRLFQHKLSFVLGGGKGLSSAYGSSDYRAFAGLSYLGDREIKQTVPQAKVPVLVTAPVKKEPVKPVIKTAKQISQLLVEVRDEKDKLSLVDMDLINEQGQIVQKYTGTRWRKNVPPGFYILRVNKNSYAPIEKKLRLKIGKRHRHTLKLKKDSESMPLAGSKINFLGRIQFKSGKATIRPISYTALNKVVGILKKYPQITMLRIEAHSDSVGSDSLNLKLSQKRAQSVEAFLLGAGIKAERLSAIGLGETQPIETNTTPEGRAKNRRVEFRVVKTGQ